MEICWSENDYPDLIGVVRSSSEPLISLVQNKVSTDFEKKEFGIEIGTLKEGRSRFVFKKWDLPIIVNEKHLERKLPLIEQYTEEAFSDIVNYAIPYFKLLTEYRCGKRE